MRPSGEECLLRHEQVRLKAPPTERARQAKRRPVAACGKLIRRPLVVYKCALHEKTMKGLENDPLHLHASSVLGTCSFCIALEKYLPLASCRFRNPISFGISSSSIEQPSTDSTAPPITQSRWVRFLFSSAFCRFCYSLFCAAYRVAFSKLSCSLFSISSRRSS